MSGKTVGDVPARALYSVLEAMELLSLSRTQIYELIRSDRLQTVTQGRRRLVPAEAITTYVALLMSEAGSRRGRAA
jgi:excisionase family DNA binding protein